MLVSAVAGTRVLSTSIPGACASRGRASEGSPMVRYFAAAAVCVVCCLVALPRLSAQSRPAQPAVRRTAAQPQTARTAEASPAGRSRLGDEPQTDGNAAVAGEATTDEGGRPASAGAVIEMKGKPAARRAPPMTAEQEQELDAYLQQWSEASGRIFRMEGDIWKHTYDQTFETEQLSQGSFAYEQPDRGKVALTSTRATPQMLERRANDVAEARKAGRSSPIKLKKNGEPYDLSEGEDEEWWCDGRRIFQLQPQKKQAFVTTIPPQMQGQNIMDSPLPFLFGMPPEKARRRFEIGFNQSKSPGPDATRLHLVIYPNLPQDASAWHHANVMLDPKTWLPIAVQMYDPAESTVTVYRFEKLEVNGKNFIRNFWNGGKPSFEPNLTGWQVIPVGSGGPEMADTRPVPPAAPGAVPRSLQRPTPQVEAGRVPDLTGLPHKQALEILQALGLPRDEKNPKASRVSLQPGQPAATKEAVYTVESQDPKPGTEIRPNTRVIVRLYTDPSKETKSVDRAGARVN